MFTSLQNQSHYSKGSAENLKICMSEFSSAVKNKVVLPVLPKASAEIIFSADDNVLKYLKSYNNISRYTHTFQNSVKASSFHTRKVLPDTRRRCASNDNGKEYRNAK